MKPVKQSLSEDRSVYTSDFVMIRVDKGPVTLSNEMGSGRFDPEYWHPKFTYAEDIFKRSSYPIKDLGNFIKHITYGPIVVGKTFRPKKDGIFIINQSEISDTGINYSYANYAGQKSAWVLKRAMVKKNDLVIARSGMGGIGKNKASIIDFNIDACVGCFVDLIRLEGINPYYVLLFWKGIFGISQVQKIINGVGTLNINFDEIRSIKIPILPNNIQKSIERSYRDVSKAHHNAIMKKLKKDKINYNKKIEQARSLLKEIIRKTDSLIINSIGN